MLQRDGSTSGVLPPITREKHIKYFLRTLMMLPEPYSGVDTTRLSVVYFCVSALDIMGALDKVPRDDIVAWIYSLQVIPNPDDLESFWSNCGFRGGSSMGVAFDTKGAAASSTYDCSHIAMTYTALATLAILGDDFARVNKEATLRAMKEMQQPNGRSDNNWTIELTHRWIPTLSLHTCFISVSEGQFIRPSAICASYFVQQQSHTC
jgi:geranylgeranyl transferase type-1 subunit beta